MDLPLSPPPQLGVCQRPWGTWVAEITDRNTKERIWIGSFHSAAQAVKAYDIESVRHHGGNVKVNFPLGSPDWPLNDVVVPRFVSAREAREDREARERLEADQASEAYMKMLREKHLELVQDERAILELYQLIPAMKPMVQGVPVIDISSDDTGNNTGNDTDDSAKKVCDELFPSSSDEDF